MTHALIVIDMQQGSFTPAVPRYDADGLVARINTLAARVRKAAGTVIFVQNDGPEGDPHHPDLPGWKLLFDLNVCSGDQFVRKTACDPFLGTNLEDLLASIAASDLIITGCATDFCVDTTVRGALARGYRTTAPEDGHTTADRPHLSAKQIIVHHNAIWSEFQSPAGAATVCRCAEITLN